MKGFLISIFLCLAFMAHSQHFEIRLTNAGGGVIAVEMRETSGVPPATNNYLFDLVFGICWDNSFGVSLTTVTTNYTIKKAGPETVSGSTRYQLFAKDPNPINFPQNWVTNQWVTIMTIANNLAGAGTGTFSLCPLNFQDLNINIDLEDYTPVDVGAAYGVLLTFSQYRMTCFPDSVGRHTLVVGTDTIITATSLAGPISPQGLVAYFPLGAGFGAKDMSGFGNDGTIIGETFFGFDRCFDDDGAVFFNHAALEIAHQCNYSSENLSTSIWFNKANDTIFDLEKIITKGKGWDGRMLNIELNNQSIGGTIPYNLPAPWNIQMNNSTSSAQDAYLCNYYNIPGGHDSTELRVMDTVTAGCWHLVVGTLSYNSDSNLTYRRLYYDGNLLKTVIDSGKVVLNYNPITIGNEENGAPANKGFSGGLDDFRLYNRTLTPEEVLKLYHDGCSFCKVRYTHETTCDPSQVSATPSTPQYIGNDSLASNVTGLRLPSGVSNEGLIGYYPMDKLRFDEPGFIQDMSGFGNNGMMVGGTSLMAVSDSCGNAFGAYSFDGYDDYISVPYHSVWGQSDTISVACWFKKTNGVIENSYGNVETFLGQGFGGGCGTYNDYFARTFTFELKDNQPGAESEPPFNIQFNISADTTASICYPLQDSMKVFPLKWYHVVGIITPTYEKLFVNGELVVEYDLPNKILKTTAPLSLGVAYHYGSDSTTMFTGDLDNVLLFNRELTPQEISILARPCLSTVDTTLCFGESITLKNGIYTEPVTNVLDTLLTVNGCDSLQTTLTILEKKESTLNLTLCDNEPLVVGADTIMQDVENKKVVIKNAGQFGCDSIVYITRHNLPTITLIRNDTLCWEDTLVINGNSYSNQNPSGMEKMPRFGTGCDSTVFVNLTFRERALSFYHTNLCENSDTLLFGEVHSCSGDTLSFFFPGAGWMGCDSTVQVLLSCASIYDRQIDTVLFHTDTLRVLDSIYRFPYAPLSSGMHHTLSTEGCDSLISVFIHWRILNNDKFPEAITPNGDGINDVFIVSPLLESPQDFPECELLVYNRYEQVVWQSGKPYSNNWSGENIGGQPLPAGTYNYVFFWGKDNLPNKNGFVVIIR